MHDNSFNQTTVVKSLRQNMWCIIIVVSKFSNRTFFPDSYTCMDNNGTAVT